MARPQASDYDQRQKTILDHAASLFAKKGFKGTSVADLAAACKTSKSLIYHYFPSKEDILYEVMVAHLAQLAEAAAGAMSFGEQSPRGRLYALTLAFMRLYGGAADRHKVLLNELDNLPAERRTEVVLRQRGIIELVQNQIEKARPELRGDARPLTMLFFGMINWTHTWFNPKGKVSPERLADLAAGIMFDGLESMKKL